MMGFGWRAAALLGLSTLVQGQSSGWNSSSPNCQNNCLWQVASSTAVTSFCETYTTTMNTATTGLPSYVSNCQSKPDLISSACSCIVTDPPPPTTTTSAPPSQGSDDSDCDGDTCCDSYRYPEQCCKTVTKTVTDRETCYVTVTAPAQTYTITHKYV